MIKGRVSMKEKGARHERVFLGHAFYRAPKTRRNV
jgi:hypothetical protein